MTPLAGDVFRAAMGHDSARSGTGPHVRAFHDLVVGTGPVPLSTPGEPVRQFVGEAG